MELLCKRTTSDDRYLELETDVGLKSRMRENCTYGSVRGSRQAFHIEFFMKGVSRLSTRRDNMDVFEKIGDTIVNVGKDVSSKAKELSGVAKLKMDIRSKEEFVEKQYALIGKKYFETHKDDDILDYGECSSIEEALQSIKEMKKQLMELKGVKRCDKCGAEIPEGTNFCGRCGAKVDDFFEEE